MEKSDRNCVVQRTLNWQPYIQEIAGPMTSHDTRESWLARAARKSRISYRQVRALWYGQTTDPRTSVAMSVLSAAEKARAEARLLASRFENLAGTLNANDQNLYSSDVLALIDAARALRGLDRT